MGPCLPICLVKVRSEKDDSPPQEGDIIDFMFLDPQVRLLVPLLTRATYS